MRLTLRKSDLSDWFVIERAKHDGRSWLEPTAPGCLALRCSSRFSDADVEGTGEEMLAIAAAIESRGNVSFRRCSVDATGENVSFSSPRNSQVDGVCSLAEADELASIIRAAIDSVSLIDDDRR